MNEVFFFFSFILDENCMWSTCSFVWRKRFIFISTFLYLHVSNLILLPTPILLSISITAFLLVCYLYHCVSLPGLMLTSISILTYVNAFLYYHVSNLFPLLTLLFLLIHIQSFFLSAFLFLLMRTFTSSSINSYQPVVSIPILKFFLPT